MPTNTYPTRWAIAFTVGWFLTGTVWFVQAFVPWTANGTLSQSSTLDAASLIRSGAVGSAVPSIAGWLLMVLPAVGLVLFATAVTHAPTTRLVRIAAAVVAVAVTLALTSFLAEFQISNFGPGALLAWLGCVACVINIFASLRFSLR